MNTTTMNTKLARRIMRRTYYAFVIHMATRPVVRYGVPLVLLMYITAKLVFVAAVFANAKAVGFAEFPQFAYGAVAHADYVTLLSAAALLVVFAGIARDAAHSLPQAAQGYAKA